MANKFGLQTSWGSRADGDVHDTQRLLRPQRSASMSEYTGKGGLIQYIPERRMTLPSKFGAEKPVFWERDQDTYAVDIGYPE